MTRAGILALLVIAAFLLPGIVGHDPWKPDEAYTFGLVYEILQSDHWMVPMLAGEPFMEKPPLYFLTAAWMARMLSPVLALHDGARLASLAFLALTALFTGLAAQRLFGPGRGHRAALLLVGSLGLAMHSHELITDTAFLAGIAMAALGLAHALDRPRLAGALLGTGTGVAFMAKGLLAPGMVAPACLLLPAFFGGWRTRCYVRTLAWALAFVLPWLTAWPLALYLRDPGLFMEWFWTNNFGRYLGFVRMGASTEPWFYTRTLPWFTFPAGFAAVWAAWRVARQPGAARPALEMNAVLALWMAALLSTSAVSREIYALPVLVPLAILGSGAVDELPLRVGAISAALSGMVAFAAAGAAWALWGYGIAHGHAPDIEWIGRWLPHDFAFTLVPGAVAAALALTLLWLTFWIARPAGSSWLHLWVANLAATWGVAMLLLLPWIDSAKSFRVPFEEVGRHVGPGADCVGSVGLGEPQRAMLHYMANIKTARGVAERAGCRYMLLQSDSHGAMPPLPEGNRWTLVWEGARPGELAERFQLWTGDGRRLAKR